MAMANKGLSIQSDGLVMICGTCYSSTCSLERPSLGNCRRTNEDLKKKDIGNLQSQFKLLNCSIQNFPLPYERFIFSLPLPCGGILKSSFSFPFFHFPSGFSRFLHWSTLWFRPVPGGGQGGVSAWSRAPGSAAAGKSQGESMEVDVLAVSKEQWDCNVCYAQNLGLAFIGLN